MLEVGHRRPAHLRLDVVPRRPLAVDGGHRLRLRVAGVRVVVAPAVREVDAADEGDGLALGIGGPEHDELLMVRTARPDALVEQHHRAGVVRAVADVLVLPLVHPDLVEVRAPHQPADQHPALGGAAEQVGEPDGAASLRIVGRRAPRRRRRASR